MYNYKMSVYCESVEFLSVRFATHADVVSHSRRARLSVHTTQRVLSNPQPPLSAACIAAIQLNSNGNTIRRTFQVQVTATTSGQNREHRFVCSSSGAATLFGIGTMMERGRNFRQIRT